jgi:hypothetical protein
VGVCATSAGAHPSSGLLRARDYDTDTGRFDAVDAFGNANQRSAVSTYAYADQNPLVGADRVAGGGSRSPASEAILLLDGYSNVLSFQGYPAT